MKKMVKLLSVVLIVAFLIVGVLSGCGNSAAGTGNAANGSSSAASTAAASKPAETVTLKFYTSTDDATNKQRKWNEFIADFEKKNPGIKVEMAPLVANVNTDEYKKKADIMVAGGDQIDLLRTSAVYELTKGVDNGIYEPLDDYAAKAGINLNDEFKGIIDIKGKKYAIPEEITPWLVFINKDMLDAAGLPVPPADWTWNDYRTYAKKLTKGEGANKVYGSFMNDWSQFFSVGVQSEIFDDPFYTKDNKLNFDNSIFRGGLQYRHDLENADKSQVPYIDMKSQKLAYRTEFFGGKVAMVCMGSWLVADIQNKEKYPHTFKTTFATYPRWTTNSKPNTSYLDGAGAGWSINAHSQYKEQAFKFLYALLTEGAEKGHTTWSPWRKADAEAQIKGIVGPDESLYDLDAFKKVVYDPQRVDNIVTRAGPGEDDVIQAFTDEAEKYFVNGQSLDDCLKNTIKKANYIVAKAKE